MIRRAGDTIIRPAFGLTGDVTITAAQADRARRYVCAHARDAGDARLLLAMLGLLDGAP